MVNEIKQKEYCRLTGLTRKALLIYEQKGLLSPHRIDTGTGYRFYCQTDIVRGIRIAFLRSMDFSLPEIESILENPELCSSVLQKKEHELIRQSQLIEHGLRFINLNKSAEPFSESVREMRLPLYQIATMEGRGSVRDITVHMKLLSRYVRSYDVIETGPAGTYFFADSTPEEIHFKVFVPVSGEWLTAPNGFLIENFGAPRFLFVRHYGTYELLPIAYDSLRTALAERGDYISGEYIEIYRNQPSSLIGNDTTTLITDIGVPQWY